MDDILGLLTRELVMLAIFCRGEMDCMLDVEVGKFPFLLIDCNKLKFGAYPRRKKNTYRKKFDKQLHKTHAK